MSDEKPKSLASEHVRLALLNCGLEPGPELTALAEKAGELFFGRGDALLGLCQGLTKGEVTPHGLPMGLTVSNGRFGAVFPGPIRLGLEDMERRPHHEVLVHEVVPNVQVEQHETSGDFFQAEDGSGAQVDQHGSFGRYGPWQGDMGVPAAEDYPPPFKPGNEAFSLGEKLETTSSDLRAYEAAALGDATSAESAEQTVKAKIESERQEKIEAFKKVVTGGLNWLLQAVEGRAAQHGVDLSHSGAGMWLDPSAFLAHAVKHENGKNRVVERAGEGF